jgi:hypothetical protein
MKKQNIEDIFSSMENFSSIPPPELWANIEEKLDKPKKKKRAILWWSAAACLLLGLLLPSVLYFSSNNGIQTITNGTGGNNSVVIDESKKDLNTNRTISTEENSTVKQSEIVKSSSEDSLKNNSTTVEEIQTKETAVAHADSKNNSSSSALKSNSEKRNTNQAVAEQTTISEKESQINSTFSKNKNLNSQKRNRNQAVAEKTYTTGNQNQFNSFSKNQSFSPEKRKGNQALAEKTFTNGKQNQFNSFSQHQLPNSVFENQSNTNSATVALGNSNSVSNNKQTTAIENKKEVASNKAEKTFGDNNTKGSSKFNNVLSKQDSVQLAELQNLEKGIIPADEKENVKKSKTSSTAEKWALEVFAGIANSENYKNEKTLGNANDSKQGSTYGVKTKYKINKKWAVGSGLKINELGQSVANVSYIKTADNAFLSTGDYFVQNSTVPQIASTDGYVLVSNATKNALKSDNLQSGNLDQSLRYIEMPLEVSYAIFSKNKASISLNTGGFVGKLISNSVAIDGNSLGENINANDFVYGSTLSSTLQYRVYKKTNVFVEPAMNYYVNPLNSQSFNQFQWGLNFGLNVSF